MIKRNFRSIILFIVFLCSTASMFAQESERPRDIVIVLDVSGSMKEAGIEQDVKEYLIKEVVNSLLQTGDSITLKVFGEETRTQLTRTINSAEDLRYVTDEINAIDAADHFTDLGSALEGMDAILQERSDASAVPIALFITDGKNAPPQWSPHYGKDISSDEYFVDIGKRISMKGWRLYVVGLGAETDAESIAELVEGSTLVSDDQALNPELLQDYAEEQAEASEELAQELKQNKNDNAATAQDSAESQEKTEKAEKDSTIPIVPIAAALAVIALLLIVFFIRKKKAA